MALAGKLDNEDLIVYTHCWVTARFRKVRYGRLPCLQAHRQLDNLVVIVDNNGLQIDGRYRRCELSVPDR